MGDIVQSLFTQRFFTLFILLAAWPWAAGAQVRIGQSLDLTGSAAEHGKAVLSGIQAYLGPVNAAGGVGGQPIELITLDDGGKADRAAENTRSLIERNAVVAMFSGIEGGPCVASMKVAVERRVPLIGCAAGSPELREPFNRYVFPVRAEHLAEFEMIVKAAKQFGRTRIAFIHSDSETGRRHLANLTRVAQAEGVEIVAAIPLKSGAEALAPRAIAAQLVARRAQAVLNHGAYATYADVYREARVLDASIQFYAVNSGAQQMVKLLGATAKGLIFTQVVPFPWGTVPSVVNEYRRAMKLHAPHEELSFSSLEGYLNARVLVAALKQSGRKPDPESIVAALENAGRIDVGGFQVSYSRSTRAGSSFVDTVLARTDGRFMAR
jgi:ABC-type branched-subunit amino acid transport system substrate-binding protein